MPLVSASRMQGHRLRGRSMRGRVRRDGVQRRMHQRDAGCVRFFGPLSGTKAVAGGDRSFAPGLAPQTRVADALALYPQAAMVFVRRRMACAGCDLNVYETLAGAAACYGVALEELIGEMGDYR